MTHLRDTERRHLPQPFDKLDNNNYRDPFPTCYFKKCANRSLSGARNYRVVQLSYGFEAVLQGVRCTHRSIAKEDVN